MTSKREVANRLDQLDPGHDERIFVVAIGGEPGRGGWYTLDEYEQEFGDRPESTFNYHNTHSNGE
jgi:hypothetical protein